MCVKIQGPLMKEPRKIPQNLKNLSFSDVEPPKQKNHENLGPVGHTLTEHKPKPVAEVDLGLRLNSYNAV